jgi:two-component system, cell cycle response regulator DivK
MRQSVVLVIDDNAQNLKLVQVLLTRHGYTVHTAVDAEHAIDTLRTVTPAIILVDLQLPGMDGFELTRRLKADPRTKRIAVIAVTAYAMVGDAERALAAGCDDYVSKPIDTKALPKLIAAYIERSAAHSLN